ncbi:nucleotide exchange factor GrpE [Aliifodinibius salicampi]|uniref:Protein GrpE n=1 Tax=Fodinibius salicampi TaxID=1920655 RepID=A0ABT3PUP1_9BACT|nr:nucleotide exchange factor GrpE [Fodinibius salicampi]MCW9711562.1 nucleotide exchange factor GrpE [Fodinibius salicampi]
MGESKEESTKEVKEQEVDQQQESAELKEQLTEKFQDLDEEELRERLVNREQEYHELEKELTKTQEQHLRKAAELENYRKRVQRERSQIYETAKANALDDFLDINDDLRRTLKAAEDVEVNDTFMDGLLLVANKFEEVLNKYGVERIDEVGVPFNVDLHDAMMRKKPEDENVGSDVVLEVIENGYRMGERTIRHAKVIVSE